MQLSEETKVILKNLVEINNGMIIESKNSTPGGGTEIRQLHTEKSMQIVAKIKEHFPNSVYIYDMGAFLSTLFGGFSKDAELEFGEKDAKVTEGKAWAKVMYSYPEQIIYETKILTPPAAEVAFNLDWEVLERVLKMADSLRLAQIKFYSEGGVIKVQAVNKGNSASSMFDLEVGTGELSKPYYFKRSFFRVIPGAYAAELSSDSTGKPRMIYLKHAAIDISYRIGCEAE